MNLDLPTLIVTSRPEGTDAGIRPEVADQPDERAGAAQPWLSIHQYLCSWSTTTPRRSTSCASSCGKSDSSTLTMPRMAPRPSRLYAARFADWFLSTPRYRDRLT